MKYWIPGVIALMMASATHAEDYRLVQSPKLNLDVFIDNVENSHPDSWCANTISLRITSSQDTGAPILTDFLPRVGKLLEKQCSKVTHLSWVLINKNGKKVASGEAEKHQDWALESPQMRGASASKPTIPPAVAVTSPLASKDTIASFDLPQGCQFRTYWDGSSTLFVPGSDVLRCELNGLLHGHGAIVFPQEGGSQVHNVFFYQGYPLINIDTRDYPLTVVNVNAQRLILADANSFLVLPFDPKRHAWVFQGEVIIEMTREQAADYVEAGQKVAFSHDTWRPLVTKKEMPLTFRLVEKLAVDRVNPASGSYLSVDDVTN